MSRVLRAVLKQGLGNGNGRQCIVGQPIHATHPELLAEGELLPGIPAHEFALRRQKLAQLLSPGSVAIVPAAPVQYTSPGGRIPHPYRQEADFCYLTGILQPGVAVVESLAAHPPGKLTLFLPRHTPQEETWDGQHLSCEAAAEHFGADECLPLSDMASRIPVLTQDAPTVFYDAGRHHSNPLVAAVAALTAQPGQEQRLLAQHQRMRSLEPLVHSLRWVKSPGELRLMASAAEAAARSIETCMRASRPGVHERQLAAIFDFQTRWRGAQHNAYPPVIAGGSDATTIHYSRKDKVVHEGQLLKMDAGCERHGYVSDVTRTWPVSGRFSAPQQAVYETVLAVHRQALAQCRAGTTLRAIHASCVRELSEGLRDLGVFPQHSAEAIEQHTYRQCFPHNIGHWLGMTVHDSANVSHDLPLQPGVCLTIEPGLYFPDGSRFGRFAGIGVRIEDDVAITEGDPDVMSGCLPTDVQEVERMVGTCHWDVDGPLRR